MKIYYDSIQEGVWFQGLHPVLQNAMLEPFSGINDDSPLKLVLSYDRPDIILADKGYPILVLERTVEVPSGHNVGQRFARLVAAAQMRIPVVYFGPYAAYKHGGETQGPRYMNLRLFKALTNMAEIENTAVSIINWPVDQNYEIIQTLDKDTRVREYLYLFFKLYQEYSLPDMLPHIMASSYEYEQQNERQQFISTQVIQPEQYDQPPESVTIISARGAEEIFGPESLYSLSCAEIVLYKIGMNYIRSDPYTGMAMLYSYLYCGGMTHPSRNLVLHFPHITQQMWHEVSGSNNQRKDIRLYKLSADGILFSDGYLPKVSL